MRYTLILPLMLLPVLTTQAEEVPVFDRFTTAWRDDPVWYDGQAEIAQYDATRQIYGIARPYVATLFTNKEKASAKTFTKSATADGREVFKHHLREDIPTENYHYHHSVMAYVGTTDLKSLKLDMASQEDCGATFIQYINHHGTLRYNLFSYFPNMGHQTGQYSPPVDLVYHNALSLVLRGYPFGKNQSIQVMLLPDQISNKWTSTQPQPTTITELNLETLNLPIGKVKAYHLRLTHNEHTRADYWFAADPTWRHVMVQYIGPNHNTYKLRSLERRAYWERK